jgi:RimJ/RimL family protein N-acetyltransferase
MSSGADPLGEALDWRRAARPARTELRGRSILVRPLDGAGDAEALHAASGPSTWTYLPYGPFEDAAALREHLLGVERLEDPLFFTLARLPGEVPQGVAAYLRIEPAHGVIEIGHIWFGTPLQRTAAATEAIFLLARHAFDGLGYRRLEWKCDALNAASRRAADRFGFTFEGVFRKHMVVKGRNRDTAWYAITDERWPQVRAGFERWLDPANFDAAEGQRRRLSELIAAERNKA